MDRQQDVIRRITAHIVAYRFQLENERNSRMAIEIKGLKADALTARANLDRVRAAYARFNQAAPAHADDVDKLASDITGMQSDLEFAATVMGNSDGESEKLAKEPVEHEWVGDVYSAKPAPEPIVAQQTVTTPRVALGPHPDQPQANGATFRTEAEKQIAAGGKGQL